VSDAPDTARSAEEFLAGCDLGLAVLAVVRGVLASSHPEVVERATRSQVAFRGRRGFAFLWRPRQYLGDAAAEVVLSLALPHQLVSPRFKEVVHPSRTTWMHHLEVGSVDDLDDEVVGWLREAADAAG
jgi:Domain of unknown function (DUF5655)